MRNKKILIIFSLLIVALVLIIGLVKLWQNSSIDSLDISSVPNNIKFFLNDKEYETPTNLKLKAGKYTITAKKDEYFDFKQEIEVQPGANNKFEIVLSHLLKSSDLLNKWDQLSEDERMQYRIKADQQDEKDYQDFLKTHPLVQYLPYIASNFKIVDYSEDSYWVDLIFNSQLPQDKKTQYDKAQKDALNWIQSKGIDPGSLNLIYQKK